MDFRNYVVLIAEDDYINSLFFKSLMKKAGYEVREARDGNQVLASLENGDIDLLLLDYNLPGKNGAEVVKIIRENKDMEGISIILVSGYDKGELQERSSVLQYIDAFLEKPVMDYKMLEAVKQFLP